MLTRRQNSRLRILLRPALFLGLLLGVLATLLMASGVAEPRFLVNTFQLGTQSNPAVAMNAAGNSVVVWTSPENAGGQNEPGGVYARRYDANGSPLDAQEFLVAADGSDPAVGMDAAGNFVVAWTAFDEFDALGNPISKGVFARRLAADGTPQEPSFRVNAGTSGEQDDPAVGMSSGGNFAIAWASHTVSFASAALDPGVFVANFAADGTALGGGRIGETTSPEEHSQPAVAMDATGNFVVAWRIMHVPSFATEVVAARFDAAGAFQAPRIQVSMSAGEPLIQPAVGMDATGNFVVAWTPRFGDVLARRFDAAGTAQGPQLQLNTLTVFSFPGSIAAAMSATGSFVITWQGADSDDNAFTSAACSDGNEFLVRQTDSSSTSNRQTGAGMDSAGNAVVAWTGDRDASGEGIFASRLACEAAPPPPTLSINDVSVTEGNSGTTDATFTVTLSAASTQTVTVDYATADRTATTADNDYGAQSGTLTFNPGETSRQITILVNGDTSAEPDEVFFVNLSNASNATTAKAQGVGTILNDDNTLSINDVAVTRPRTGTTVALFTVTLSGSHGFPVTVGFATADGTARAGDDYVAQSDTLTFLPGENIKEISIVVNGHALAEPDNTFFVNLGNSAAAIIDKAQGVGSIQDPGFPRVVPGNEFSFVEFPTGTNFQVSLISHAMGMNASGQFVIAFVVPQSDGSTAIFAQRFAADATPQGVAFRVDDPTLRRGPQQAQPSVAVDANASFVIVWTDGFFDGTLFGISVIRGQRYNADGTPLGPNILVSGAINFAIGNQNEQAPSVAMTGPGEFVVAWSGLHIGDVGGPNIYAQSFDSNCAVGSQFRVNTAGSGFTPAVAASPYEFVIAWGAGGDIFARRFFDSNVPLGDQFRVNTYTANVQELPAVGMDAAGNFVVAWEGEGPGGDRGVFARCFSAGSLCSDQFHVDAATLSAHRPAVGVGASGDSVIAWDGVADANSTSGVFARLYDASGTAQGTTFQVSGVRGDFGRFRPAAGMGGGGSFVISWLADAPFGRAQIFARRFLAPPRPPAPLSLAIGNASVTRPASGAKDAVFRVTLSAASAQAVTVNFSTADGTATAGTDYQARSGTLTFAPGETAKQIAVQILGGASSSSDETFFVNLSNPANAGISRAQGTCVILPSRPIDYTISASPAGLAFTPSTTKTSSITLQAQNGISEAVQLTTAWIGTAPTGVTVQLSPAQVVVPPSGAISSTLTVATSSSPSTGTFTLRVTGQSASGVTQAIELSIFIEANLPTATCACAATGPFVDPRVKGLESSSPYATVTIVGSDFSVTRNSPPKVIASDLLSNVSVWGFSPDGQFLVLITKQESPAGPTFNLALYSVAEARVVGAVQSIRNPLSWGFSPDAGNKFFLVTTRIPDSPVNNVIISIYDTGTGQRMMEHTAIYLAGVGEPEWADEDGVHDNDSGVAGDDSDDDNNQVAGWGFSPDGFTFLLSYKTARILDQDRYFLGLWNLRHTNFPLPSEIRGDVAAFWQFSPCGDLLMLVSQAGANPANTDLVKFIHTSNGAVYREIHVDISQGDRSASPSATVITKADGSKEIQLTRMELQSIPSPQCTLSATVHSPVNILLTDERGNSTGFDPATGGVIDEIPRGSYTGVGSEPQTITVPYVMGSYVVDAYGLASLTAPQPYTLTIDVRDGSGETVDRRDLSALASRGSLQRFTFILDDEALLGSIEVVELGDTMAPQVLCAAPDGQWHANDVSLVCTASDDRSGLADPADASFSLSTHVAAGTETANATTDSREVCDAAGTCATAGPIAGNMVDKKAPFIAIDVAPGPYLVGQLVAANYACNDEGSGVASCAGPVASGTNLDTASVGAKSFTVFAADRVGNTSSRSVDYVVSYGIGLLYDSLLSKKAGSAYPIKVQLRDANGTNLSSPEIVLHAVSLTRSGGGAAGPLDDTGNANPEFDFRYDAVLGGYMFNLSTKGLSEGRYSLIFRAGADPTLHSAPFAVR